MTPTPSVMLPAVPLVTASIVETEEVEVVVDVEAIALVADTVDDFDVDVVVENEDDVDDGADVDVVVDEDDGSVDEVVVVEG